MPLHTTCENLQLSAVQKLISLSQYLFHPTNLELAKYPTPNNEYVLSSQFSIRVQVFPPLSHTRKWIDSKIEYKLSPRCTNPLRFLQRFCENLQILLHLLYFTFSYFKNQLGFSHLYWKESLPEWILRFSLKFSLCCQRWQNSRSSMKLCHVTVLHVHKKCS